MKVHGRFILLSLSLATGPIRAETLTLDDYLAAVKGANQTLEIAETIIAAGELRSQSTDIIFSPQFFSQASHASDSKTQISPLAPEKFEATNLTFGIQQLWESGLQSQISYSMTRVQLEQPSFPGSYSFVVPVPNPSVPGSSLSLPVTIPNPILGLRPRDEYTEAKAQLDLVQPLWKNSGGQDYRLTRESTQTKIQMQKLGESFKVKSLLAQAEYVYWQLALAREALRNQEGTIERLQRIRAWAASRARSQLGDQVDYLQADSGLKAKLLELELSKKDRNALERVFNTLRGVEGGEVSGTLQPLSSKGLRSEAQELDGQVKRLDIEIAKKAERLSEIEVEQSREKFKAQLDVFGSLALNALRNTPEEALIGSADTSHPTLVVGVKFSTPLDHDLINRDRQGLVKTSWATRLDRELKEFNAQQDWKDLKAQLDEAATRLRLAEDLEEAQKTKLTYERRRLDSGRTTTYQILMFENDFALSQLATIKAKADILGIQAKLKSFGDAA